MMDFLCSDLFSPEVLKWVLEKIEGDSELPLARRSFEKISRYLKRD